MLKIVCLIFLISITVSSCSTISLGHRKGRDKYLFEGDFNSLRGEYVLITSDTLNSEHKISVQLHPIDSNSIELITYQNDSLVAVTTLKGRFADGYFKARRQYNCKFLLGPLVWILYENRQFVGLTKEDNLIVLSSGGSGYMLLVAFPLFAAGAGESWHEYQRVK